MNAERYQQVKQIFLAACDLEPGPAAALLAEACAGDPELRREVESLIFAHAGAGELSAGAIPQTPAPCIYRSPTRRRQQ